MTTPLTVPEARVVLRADEALDLTYETRLAAGTMFNDEERETWIGVELLVEVSALRVETAGMRPVYEAAKKWRVEHNENHNCCDAVADLYAAIDAAVAAEEP